LPLAVAGLAYRAASPWGHQDAASRTREPLSAVLVDYGATPGLVAAAGEILAGH